jgi:hypothetical protein
MTYNTPTLLLVGAAQHLVLGSDSIEPVVCLGAPDNPPNLKISRNLAEW